MNKTDLVSRIAEKTEMKKKDVEKLVNAFTETVEEALVDGDKVQ